MIAVSRETIFDAVWIAVPTYLTVITPSSIPPT